MDKLKLNITVREARKHARILETELQRAELEDKRRLEDALYNLQRELVYLERLINEADND